MKNLTTINSNNFFKSTVSQVDYAILFPMIDEAEYIRNFFSKYPTEKIKVKISAGNILEFTVFLYKDKRILLAYTGIGTTSAGIITTLVQLYFRPEFIFLSGTAGGIKENLNLCDVIIATQVFEAEMGDIFAQLTDTPFESALKDPLSNQKLSLFSKSDEELLELAHNIMDDDVTIYFGTIVSSNAFPTPKELFKQIKENGAFCIDMESSAFFRSLELLKISRGLVIRSISNKINSEGTDENVSNSDLKGSAKAAAETVLKILNALILKYTNDNTCNLKQNNYIHSRL